MLRSAPLTFLREDAHLRDVALNADDDPLRFTADEVDAIESFDGVRLPRQGLALYDEEVDDKTT